MRDGRPSFRCPSVRGRGTTCWPVWGPGGTKLLVKLSFRSSYQKVTEQSLLKYAKGLHGVGQLVMVAEGPSVSTLRGWDTSLPSGAFQDRVQTFIVLEEYGKSIDHFESVYQVLVALHDAIMGHQRLHTVSILHQDISINNVVFGQSGASEGNRGVLIDLDVGSWVDCVSSNGDGNVGTRMFQSCSVLGAIEALQPIGRDHLDDIESFLYVFAYLVLAYAGPAKRFPTSLGNIEGWDNPSAKKALLNKYYFLSGWQSVEIASGISAFWGDHCLSLLEQMREYMFNKHTLKMRYGYTEPNPEALYKLRSRASANADYAYILNLIQNTIIIEQKF